MGTIARQSSPQVRVAKNPKPKHQNSKQIPNPNIQIQKLIPQNVITSRSRNAVLDFDV
jgi:hypothetical protein